jgi:hypothetical protein
VLAPSASSDPIIENPKKMFGLAELIPEFFFFLKKMAVTFFIQDK